MTAFLHGFFLSFGLILPLGAQNIFLFNQGANQPRWIHTLPVIITAGLCDTILIGVSITGISLVLLSIPWLKVTLSVIGCLMLLYIGWSVWRSNDFTSMEDKQYSIKKQIKFTLSVSLLNPHAIMDTIGVIGTNASVYHSLDKWLFFFSCVLVSWLWFVFLTFSGRVMKNFASATAFFTYLNKISAVLIWMVALYLIYINLVK